MQTHNHTHFLSSHLVIYFPCGLLRYFKVLPNGKGLKTFYVKSTQTEELTLNLSTSPGFPVQVLSYP